MKKKANTAFSVDFYAEFAQFFTGFGTGFTDVEQVVDSSESTTDYLAREERILTLARKRFKRALVDFSLEHWEEKLYAEIPGKGELLGDVVKRISRTVIRPLLREMSSFTDDAATTLLKLLEFPGIKVTFYDVSKVPGEFYREFRRKLKDSGKLKDSDFLVVTLEEAGMAPVTMLGAKNIAHPVNLKDCYFGNYPSYSIADLADCFSYLAVYVQVMKEVTKIRNGEESLFEDSFRKSVDEFRLKFIKNNTYLRVPPACMVPVVQGECQPSAKEEFFKENAWEKLLSTPINWDRWDNVEQDVIDFMISKEIPVHRYTGTQIEKGFKNGEFERIIHFNGTGNWYTFYACFILETDMSFRSFCGRWPNGTRGYSCMPVSRKVKGFLFEDKRVSLLADLFYFIAKEKYQLSEMARHYRELDGEYAKSFMSKKLNVQKVKDAMEKSIFNQYFGFVEFDEETDLAEVEEVAKEFQALKDTYLRGVNSKENVIRFRKLGHHKASGLYYPGFACLCVDIRSPKSLAHEYGHLIDYTYGNLSITASFMKVREAYEEEFNSYLEDLPEDSSMAKVLNGKTKFNKNYYLKATEVFARCFELYLSVCLGVRNSIVPIPSELRDGIYPQSGYFLSSVKSYFDELLNGLEHGSDDERCLVLDGKAAKK